MKRWFPILCAVVLAMSLVTVGVLHASAADASGTCGENLVWTLEDNDLIISGTGPMYNYSETNPAPWADLQVYECEIEDGVTTIGDYAFFYEGIAGLSIRVPQSVVQIGQKAFAKRHSIVYFLGSAPVIADDVFEDGYGSCFYITGWDESDIQSYGGRHKWVKGELSTTASIKSVYTLNETINREDFVLRATFNGLHTTYYTPKEVHIEEYDNSTYGEKKVKVVADELEFIHTYFVTDGQSHLEYVEVEVPPFQFYTSQEIKVEPTVTAGSITLTKGKHYDVSYKNNIEVGADAQVIVTGLGEWEDLSQTVSFCILRADLSNASTSIGAKGFLGLPLEPEVSVYMSGYRITAGKDYVIGYGNNVNMGTASFYVAGTGNYYGYKKGSFIINDSSNTVKLTGAYNGEVTGELNGEVAVNQIILTPGVFKGEINDLSHRHYAYYELYKVNGEEPSLVTTMESEYGYFYNTAFSYDFSGIYEEAQAEGGAVYMLMYTWVDSTAKVYAGAYVLYIPAKVADATAMIIERIEGADDFRRIYLSAYGLDGNVGEVSWSSSNTAIATVDGGIVTLKKPGKVTITGQYGDLISLQEITISALDISNCDFFNYNTLTQEACVSNDNVLLLEGTDYTCTVSDRGNMTEVTITGCGLFTGQLVRQFDTATGEGAEHTHSFSAVCDTTCNGCDFTRATTHQFDSKWDKDMISHWHSCTACGEKGEATEHTISSADANFCTVCGALYTPGDINNDGKINSLDGLMLMRHLNGWTLDIASEEAMDVNGDGKVNSLDGLLLMRYLNGWDVTIG